MLSQASFILPWIGWLLEAHAADVESSYHQPVELETGTCPQSPVTAARVSWNPDQRTLARCPAGLTDASFAHHLILSHRFSSGSLLSPARPALKGA